MSKTVLSGIQPTGEIHLGNYFGAVSNWVELQEQYKCFFSIVDCHSMTMPYNAELLRENTWKMAFQVLACGVDPSRMFIQSLIPEHLELTWTLGCVCSHGELSRMTQFKDKVAQLKSQNKEGLASAGLFYYPVLQAADILIYRADLVPVGKDQEQHLELTRNIADRFNHQFKTDYFKLPECLFTNVPKLLSTADPLKKMSKSLGEKHHILVFGDEETIRKQIKTAVTGDPVNGVMSPGVQNLFTILKASGNLEAYDTLIADHEGGTLRYSSLKDAVSDSLMNFLTPFREKYKEILNNQNHYKDQIIEASREIRKVAAKTMKEVKDITGLLNDN